MPNNSSSSPIVSSPRVRAHRASTASADSSRDSFTSNPGAESTSSSSNNNGGGTNNGNSASILSLASSILSSTLTQSSTSSSRPPHTTTRTNSQKNGGSTKSDDEPQAESKMILCSAKDDFVLSQDVCVMCGSFGKGEDGRLIGCSQCGQCYHPYCVNIKVTRVILTKGWRCLDCTVCEGCGLPHDEAKLLLCDECDISFHTYCLDPPLSEVPPGTWKCHRCVVCIKCSSTSPGIRSSWQKNYTECGPCASQSSCPVCSKDYQESDLIIQCSDCTRWLHSKCDGMESEDDCEIAADFGYRCLLCRQKDEPSAHVTVRRAMQAKIDEYTSKDKPPSSKGNSRRPSTEMGPNGVLTDSKEISSNALLNSSQNTSQTGTKGKGGIQVQILDGVPLSEAGLNLIKSLFPEPTKRTRNRKKTGQLTSTTPVPEALDEGGKDEDASIDEMKTGEGDSSLPAPEGEGAKKKRQRRGVKVGVGGFSVKIRSRAKDDIESTAGDGEPSIDGENVNQESSLSSAAKRRRRRRTRKKEQLQDTFPAYMQEAFFGKGLVDSTKTEGAADGAATPTISLDSVMKSLDEGMNEVDDLEENQISRDKTVDLPLKLRGTASGEQVVSRKNSQQSNLTDDSNDVYDEDAALQYTDAFKDLLPQDEDLMKMLMTESEGLEKDETLELQAKDTKDAADDAIVSELDLLSDIDGLPYMDGQDVDDIFSGVLSPNANNVGDDFNSLNVADVGGQQQQLPKVQAEQQIHLAPMNQQQQQTMLPLPNVIGHPQQQPHGIRPPLVSPYHQPQGAPIQPSPLYEMQTFTEGHQPHDALPSLSPTVGNRGIQQAQWQQQPIPQPPPQQAPVQAVEIDAEATQSQKNFVKWEIDEQLGPLATISPVLYANLAFPNLKQEYPNWPDRVKHIAKLWRQLPTDARQPYLQKARDNRAASRINKSQGEGGSKTAPQVAGAKVDDSEQERQWKQVQANQRLVGQPPMEMGAAGEVIPPQQYGGPTLQQPPMQMQPQMQRMPTPPVMPPHPQRPMIPPPQQQPQIRVMAGGKPQNMRPPLEPIRIPVSNFDGSGGGGGFPSPHTPSGMPPQRPVLQRSLSQQRFSPVAATSSPSPSGDRVYQTPPPPRPSSRDSFGGDGSHQHQLPASPFAAQPKTPVATSPFPPASPSQQQVNVDQQQQSRPQPPSPFSPMGQQQNRSSPHPGIVRQDSFPPPSTPGSTTPAGEGDIPSPFARPSSTASVGSDSFIAPQQPPPSMPSSSDPYAQMPMTPRPSTSQDAGDPYNRPVMTARPTTGDDGFARPTRPISHGNFQQPGVPRPPTHFAQRMPPPPPRSQSNDPYAVQPGTPMPSTSSQDPYANAPRTPMPSFSQGEGEGHGEVGGARQQLRDLLQRRDSSGGWSSDGNRPRMPPPVQQPQQMRPSTDFGFRAPPPPPSLRPRPPQPGTGQMMPRQQMMFRHPGDPSSGAPRLMHRPGMQEGMMRPPGQMVMQGQPRPHMMQQPQQQWQRMPQRMEMMSSPRVPMPPQVAGMGQPPQQQMQRPHFPQQQQQMIPQPVGDNSHDTLTENDPGLPDELDDDELLNMGSDFNILEFGDPDLAAALAATGSGKSSIFDDNFDPNKQGQQQQPPPPYPKVEGGNIPPPPYPQQQQPNSGQPPPQQQTAPDSLLSDLEFETLKADLMSDDGLHGPEQPPQQPQTHFQNQMQHPQHQGMPPQQHHYPGPQQHQVPQQQHWQHHPQQIHGGGDPRFMHQPPPPQHHPHEYQQQHMMHQQHRFPPQGMMQRMPQQHPQQMPIGHPGIMASGPPRPPGQQRPPPTKYQLQLLPEPPLPPGEPITDQDHQLMANYQRWIDAQKNHIDHEKKKLEANVAQLRKLKKNLNTRARSLKKANAELPESEAMELSKVSADLNVFLKGLDAVKKAERNHASLMDQFRDKLSRPPGPVMVGAPSLATQSAPSIHSPRSVNSPLLMSGPGTPGGMSLGGGGGPGTPQSPSLMSPSPLSTQSPGHSIHSPAPGTPGGMSLGHHSPAHSSHSPVTYTPQQQRSPIVSQSGGGHPLVPPPTSTGDDFSDGQQQQPGMRGPMGFQPQQQQGPYGPPRMPGHFQQQRPYINQPMGVQQGQPYHPQQQQQGQQMHPQHSMYQQQQQMRQQMRQPPPPPYPGQYGPQQMHQQQPGPHHMQQMHPQHQQMQQMHYQHPPRPQYTGHPGQPGPGQQQQMVGHPPQTHPHHMQQGMMMDPRLQQPHPQQQIPQQQQPAQQQGLGQQTQHPQAEQQQQQFQQPPSQLQQPPSQLQQPPSQLQQQNIAPENQQERQPPQSTPPTNDTNNVPPSSSVEVANQQEGKGNLEEPIVGEAKTTLTLTFEGEGSGKETEGVNEAFLNSLKKEEDGNGQATNLSSNTPVKVESVMTTSEQTSTTPTTTTVVTTPVTTTTPIPRQTSVQEVLRTSSLTVTMTTVVDTATASHPPSDSGATTPKEKDESTPSTPSTTPGRQGNVLLKQLLQNCPAADASNGAAPAPAVAVVPPVPVVISSSSSSSSSVDIRRLSSESTKASSGSTADPETVVIKKEPSTTNQLSEELDDVFSSSQEEVKSSDQGDGKSTTPTPPVAPTTERKMSYLDIRRAQLEREPTPPPEEVKPKRKRNPYTKKKDRESRKENMGEGTTTPTTPPTSGTPSLSDTPPQKRKRSRKGSLKGAGGEAGEGGDYEALISGVMSALRKLPPMPIVEPEIRPNLNAISTVGTGDLNSTAPSLRGSFGKGVIESSADKGNGQQKGFYNQEINPAAPLVNKTDYFTVLRGVDSPISFIPASPDESQLEEDPTVFFRSLSEDDIKESKKSRSSSPFVPISLSLPAMYEPVDPDVDRVASPPSSSGDSDPERDKENASTPNKSGCFTPPLVCGPPLKEAGNVAVTLTLSAESADIKRVLGALAKLLEMAPPSEFHVMDKDDFGEMRTRTHRYCKICDVEIENGEGITRKLLDFEDDVTVSFCGTTCFNQFSQPLKREDGDQVGDKTDDGQVPDVKPILPPISPTMMDVDDDAFERKDGDMSSTGHEESSSRVPSPMHVDESTIPDEATTKTPSPPVPSWADEILDKLSIPFDPSVPYSHRKWKDIRYKTWTATTFEPTNPVEEESTEEAEELLKSLELNIPPNSLPVDERKCSFCHEVGDGESDGPGRLLNLDIDKWVHLNCALWSTDVYETVSGSLMSVDLALQKALSSICVRCHKNGASLRCFKLRCANIYHMNCAIKEKCMFLKDKSFYCPQHLTKNLTQPDQVMTSFVVHRRVYVNRDENKQMANLIQDQGVIRIGSLVLLNIGQLLPQQLANFHSPTCIYPVGYKVARFYWDGETLGRRKKYICAIVDSNGYPEFVVEQQERGHPVCDPEEISRRPSPLLAWNDIIGTVARMNREKDNIKVFLDQITGEDLFGLSEMSVIRILESMPGVDTLSDYHFRFNRSQFFELPLAINPSGCARTEPKLRTHFKRPHTMHSSNPSNRSALHTSFSSVQEVHSPYVKQFVHSKSSQYRTMKREWRNNVYLARSRIAGLGLFAARDIEKHTMVIEYIGLLIRNEIAERNERHYEQQNRGGVYMFRLDDNTVIDATLQGGLARYINHSCNPNCVAEQVQIDRENKIIIFANRRIQKGEELAYDYRFDLEDDSHKIPCNCGATGCRKWMN